MAKEVENAVNEPVVETTTEATASNTKAMKRGTIIQAVKAIAVLVCICLVCGALLALCNDLFYISPAERARREEEKINAALTSVYPDLKDSKTMTINKQYSSYGSSGTISKVVKSADGAYVIAATGNGGFGGKPITVLVAINPNGTIYGWTVSDVGEETYMNDVLKNTGEWYVGATISTDLELLKQTNATYSSIAVNNAIKTASYYAMNALNLGSNPQKDAENAIMALLAGTDYADYELTVNTDTKYRAALSDAENAMNYFFVGTKADVKDTLDIYVFNVESNPQVVVLHGNLSYADRHEASAIVVKSDGIDDTLVNKVLNLNYNEFKVQGLIENFKLKEVCDVTGYDNANATINNVIIGDDDTIVVNATGKGGFSDGTVTVNVVIKDGVITNLNVESHDAQSFFNLIESNWDMVKGWFVDKSIDTVFETTPPNDSGSTDGHTGATYSENAIIRAINYACEYVKNEITQGGGN
ncbi:MAG: FMN-binding protein [Clostridia bacterium]|nr:FMN-binding protein [Clostridia bacterium]